MLQCTSSAPQLKPSPLGAPGKGLLFADVLRPAAIFVIEGWQDKLVPLELALLHPGQGWCRRVPPFGDEDNEGQRLTGALQQFLIQEEKNCFTHGSVTYNELSGKKAALWREQH